MLECFLNFEADLVTIYQLIPSSKYKHKQTNRLCGPPNLDTIKRVEKTAATLCMLTEVGSGAGNKRPCPIQLFFIWEAAIYFAHPSKNIWLPVQSDFLVTTCMLPIVLLSWILGRKLNSERTWLSLVQQSIHSIFNKVWENFPSTYLLWLSKLYVLPCFWFILEISGLLYANMLVFRVWHLFRLKKIKIIILNYYSNIAFVKCINKDIFSFI